MGSAVDYHCTTCGYSVEYMVSGYDVGMATHVHAVLCHDCGELRVAQLPGHPWEVDRGGDELDGEATRARHILRCPVSVQHEVEPWSHPGPCPRCRTTLTAGEHFLMWD